MQVVFGLKKKHRNADNVHTEITQANRLRARSPRYCWFIKTKWAKIKNGARFGRACEFFCSIFFRFYLLVAQLKPFFRTESRIHWPQNLKSTYTITFFLLQPNKFDAILHKRKIICEKSKPEDNVEYAYVVNYHIKILVAK